MTIILDKIGIKSHNNLMKLNEKTKGKGVHKGNPSNELSNINFIILFQTVTLHK